MAMMPAPIARSSRGVLPGNMPLMTTGVKQIDRRRATASHAVAEQQHESDDADDAEHALDDTASVSLPAMPARDVAQAD